MLIVYESLPPARRSGTPEPNISGAKSRSRLASLVLVTASNNTFGNKIQIYSNYPYWTGGPTPMHGLQALVSQLSSHVFVVVVAVVTNAAEPPSIRNRHPIPTQPCSSARVLFHQQRALCNTFTRGTVPPPFRSPLLLWLLLLLLPLLALMAFSNFFFVPLVVGLLCRSRC